MKKFDNLSVYEGLGLECLVIEEQVKLVHFFLEDAQGRQIVSNLEKIDADKDYYDIEMKDVDAEKFTKNFFEKELPNYEEVPIQEILLFNRRVIRSAQDINFVVDSLDEFNEKIIYSLIQENTFFPTLGVTFENLEYVKSYIDYVVDGILQFIIYRVISNYNIHTFDILQELLDEVRNFSEKIDDQLVRKKEEHKKFNDLTSDDVRRYFSFYLRHRSKFGEEVRIYNELKEEIEKNPILFSSVPQKYQASKVILSEEEIKKATEIITEGNTNTQYKKNLIMVREFINIMAIYGNRECYSNCLQDLKVYYREICLSKATYKKQKAYKIVKDYIQKVNSAIGNKQLIPEFDKQSQYMFVREKISRGYFREKGLLSVYIAKIDFTNELYNLLLKVYWFYDFKDAVECIYTINNCLLKKIKLLVNV